MTESDPGAQEKACGKRLPPYEAWFVVEVDLSDDLDDVEPGYEYAVNQLLSDMRARTHAFNAETETEMMSRAQDRHERMEGDDAV